MTDNEQQSLAENDEVVTSEVVEEIPQNGETDPPEESETDEQKNARAIEEEATKRAAREDKRQASVQKRMDELTAQRYKAEARAEALQAELERARQPAPTQQKTASEPQRDQFDTYEAYLEARTEYRADMIVNDRLKEFHAKQTETSSRQQQEQSRQAEHRRYVEHGQKLEKEIPDYKETIEDWDVSKIPDSLVDLLLKLPDGQGNLVSYHLAKDPGLESKLLSQPQSMHGVMVGQLLASLKSTPKVSTAPAPGKPVSSSKASSSTEPPSDPEQYYAWAQKNLR